MFRDCSRSFLDFYISKLYAAFDQISIDMKLNSSHLTSSVHFGDEDGTVNNSNPPPNVQIRRSTRSRQAPDYLSRDM